MFLRLLFLLTFIPFAEIYFLVQMSDAIGFTNTLAVVFATGVLGAWLLRKQGHSILMEIQRQGAQNQLPSEALAKGFFTFVGGLLLLTPGVLTDVLGLSLIFPLTQSLWKRYFMGQWQRGIQQGSVRVYTAGSPFRGSPPESPVEPQRPARFEDVIDIEAQASKTVEKKEEDF